MLLSAPALHHTLPPPPPLPHHLAPPPHAQTTRYGMRHVACSTPHDAPRQPSSSPVVHTSPLPVTPSTQPRPSADPMFTSDQLTGSGVVMSPTCLVRPMAQFRQLTVVTATAHRQPPRKTQPHHQAATSHQHPHGPWPASTLTLRRPPSRPSARSPPLSSHFRVDAHPWPHDGCWLSPLLGRLPNTPCRRTPLLPGSPRCAHDHRTFSSHLRISCGRRGTAPPDA
jgi:hypothetical protein